MLVLFGTPEYSRFGDGSMIIKAHIAEIATPGSPLGRNPTALLSQASPGVAFRTQQLFRRVRDEYC